MRRRATVRSGQPRPGEICGQLLRAMEASEGRRRRRKRDTTPDAAGLSIKRRLLEEAVRCDPDGAEFEGWLLAQCADPAPAPEPPGARVAMARAVLEEWRLACSSSGFRSWLRSGAPSDDR